MPEEIPAVQIATPGAEPVPAPAAVAPAVTPGGLLGEQKPGTDTSEAGWWREHISEEYRGHSAMQPIQSMDDLAKSYINAQQMIGKDKVARVGADADADAKQSFMKDLGWGFAPEKPEDYNLNVEGIDAFGDLAPMKEFMGGLMHKHGVPGEAGAAIFREYLEHQSENHAEDLKALNQDKTDKLAQLRVELGPSYEFTMTKAQKAMQQISPNGTLSKLIGDNHLEAEPELIKVFAMLGDNILGDNFNPQNLNREFTTTPDDAKAEIKQLEGDKDFMAVYLSKHENPAGHQQAVDRMQKLYRLAHPVQ